MRPSGLALSKSAWRMPRVACACRPACQHCEPALRFADAGASADGGGGGSRTRAGREGWGGEGRGLTRALPVVPVLMPRLAALRTRVCVLGRPPLPAERLHPVALHAPLVVGQRDGRAVRVRAEPRRVVRQPRHGGRGRRRERASALRHRRARGPRALCRPRAAPPPALSATAPAASIRHLRVRVGPESSGQAHFRLICQRVNFAIPTRGHDRSTQTSASRPPHRRPCASPSSGSFRRLPRRPRSFDRVHPGAWTRRTRPSHPGRGAAVPLSPARARAAAFDLARRDDGHVFLPVPSAHPEPCGGAPHARHLGY